MRSALLGALLLTACATGPTKRPTYWLEYRPSRPADCELDYFGPNRPRPPHLVELGRIPLTVGLWTKEEEVLAAVQPRACEAGALAVDFVSNGNARVLGGTQRVRDVELVFLALPAEETVTETRAIIAGAAVSKVSTAAAAGIPQEE